MQEEAEERAVGDPEETPAQEGPGPPVAAPRAPSAHLHPELNDLHLASLSSLCLPSASCKAQGDDRSPRLGAAWRGCSGFVTLIPAAPVNNLLEAQGEHRWVHLEQPIQSPWAPTADAGVGDVGGGSDGHAATSFSLISHEKEVPVEFLPIFNINNVIPPPACSGRKGQPLIWRN